MKPSGTRAILGVVRDARGAPVAQARVYFISGPGALPDVAALTDRHGRFALGAPRAGDYEIGCSDDTLGSARVSLSVGDTDARIDLWLAP